jgi:hypothetical protein
LSKEIAAAPSSPAATSASGVIKDQEGQKAHDRAFAIAHQEAMESAPEQIKLPVDF